MNTDEMKNRAEELYNEGYLCFNKFITITPTGVRLFTNLVPGEEGYDPVRGVALYQQAVELGNDNAMFELGNCYHDGIGVEQDYEKAFMLYLQGAAKGNDNARRNLAWAYAYGEGVKQDREEALRIFKQFDSDSYPEYQIGMMYAYTCQSYEDGKQAIQWLEKLLERAEYLPAMVLLAECYSFLFKEYMEPYYERADYLLEKALERKYSDAAFRLGMNIYYQDSLITDINRAVELFKMACDREPYSYYMLFLIHYDTKKEMYNPQLALEYIRKAAELGVEDGLEFLEEVETDVMEGNMPTISVVRYLNAVEMLDGPDYMEGFNIISQLAQEGESLAQYELGMLYYEGRIVPMNKNIAYQWLDRAAAANHSDALYQIAKIYAGGDGNELRPNNDKLAVEYYDRAARLGHALAQYELANMVLGETPGINYDVSQAFQWALTAAENGINDAVFFVGAAYAQGTGVRQDSAKAVEWLKRSADINEGWNSAVAQGVIGNWYLNGTNVPKDYDLAVKYLQMAVNNGREDARADLATALRKKNKKGLFGLI